MASARQIAANRANAQRSTGPRTAAGKAAAAGNARKHGLFAKEVLAMGEDRAGFAELGRCLRQALAPEGGLEEALCARIGASAAGGTCSQVSLITSVSQCASHQASQHLHHPCSAAAKLPPDPHHSPRRCVHGQRGPAHTQAALEGTKLHRWRLSSRDFG
jgi:hypothetical protein